MWASWSGLPQVAAALLDGGADHAVADNKGYTALMLGTMRGNAAVVKLLVERGADRAAKNLEGRTAADMARDMAAKNFDKRDDYDRILPLVQ